MSDTDNNSIQQKPKPTKWWRRKLNPLISFIVIITIAVLVYGIYVYRTGAIAEERLITLLRAADKVVVSYDPCLFNVEEMFYVEIEDEEIISELIDSIDIVRTSGRCLCHGYPDIQFYSGGELVAEIAPKHEKRLRWRGDFVLTSESAERIRQWLAAKAPYSDTLSEDDVIAKYDAVLERREAMYLRVMRKELYNAYEAAGLDSPGEGGGEHALRESFEAHVPDETARAELAFRILGCDDSTWCFRGSLDQFVEYWVLNEIDRDVLESAILNAADDPDSANGAARWFFSKENWRRFTSDPRVRIIEAIGERALAHPRRVNRNRAVNALGDLECDATINLLRKTLSGSIEPRTLGEDDIEDGMGESFYPRGDSFDIPNSCPTHIAAACVLAQLGDAESLPKTRELAETATGKEKELLDAALMKLEEEQ